MKKDIWTESFDSFWNPRIVSKPKIERRFSKQQPRFVEGSREKYLANLRREVAILKARNSLARSRQRQRGEGTRSLKDIARVAIGDTNISAIKERARQGKEGLYRTGLAGYAAKAVVGGAKIVSGETKNIGSRVLGVYGNKARAGTTVYEEKIVPSSQGKFIRRRYPVKAAKKMRETFEKM